MRITSLEEFSKACAELEALLEVVTSKDDPRYARMIELAEAIDSYSRSGGDEASNQEG